MILLALDRQEGPVRPGRLDDFEDVGVRPRDDRRGRGGGQQAALDDVALFGVVLGEVAPLLGLLVHLEPRPRRGRPGDLAVRRVDDQRGADLPVDDQQAMAAVVELAARLADRVVRAGELAVQFPARRLIGFGLGPRERQPRQLLGALQVGVGGVGPGSGQVARQKFGRRRRARALARQGRPGNQRQRAAGQQPPSVHDPQPPSAAHAPHVDATARMV